MSLLSDFLNGNEDKLILNNRTLTVKLLEYLFLLLGNTLTQYEYEKFKLIYSYYAKPNGDEIFRKICAKAYKNRNDGLMESQRKIKFKKQCAIADFCFPTENVGIMKTFTGGDMYSPPPFIRYVTLPSPGPLKFAPEYQDLIYYWVPFIGPPMMSPEGESVGIMKF